MKITLFFILVGLVSAGSVNGQQAWIEKERSGGMVISHRKSASSSFNDIRVEMDLPGTRHQLDSVLLAVDGYVYWAYSTRKSYLVSGVPSSGDIIYYSEISAPWPVSNRDLYARVHVKKDSAVNVDVVTCVGVPEYKQHLPGCVRIPQSSGLWTIQTLSESSIHLVYQLKVDPGGALPAWIVNLFSAKGPLETFRNLKGLMSRLNTR